MRRPSRKIALAAAACIALAAILCAAPGYMAARLKAALRAGGFQIVSVGETHVGLSGVTMKDIVLDPHGNSTIALINAPLGLNVSAIYISGLVLSGEIGPAGMPVIDGWSFRPLAFPRSLRNIVLDSFRLDLMTSAGNITVEAKGQMISPGRKTRHIDAVIFGNQQQLTFETKWDMNWSAHQGWSAAGEIGELRVRLGNFEATRANGWLNLQSGKDMASPPVLSGQLAAGLVTFGPAILRNAGLTINGPWRGLDLILTGQPDGQKAVQLSAEARQKDGVTGIDATLTAPGPDDIFNFLMAVNTGLETDGNATGTPLAPLLLTEGNIARMKKELAGMKYTGLTMTLTGQADALNGAIKTDGAPPQTISFDPQQKPLNP
jgi:hypothetical protein